MLSQWVNANETYDNSLEVSATKQCILERPSKICVNAAKPFLTCMKKLYAYGRCGVGMGNTLEKGRF